LKIEFRLRKEEKQDACQSGKPRNEAENTGFELCPAAFLRSQRGKSPLEVKNYTHVGEKFNSGFGRLCESGSTAFQGRVAPGKTPCSLEQVEDGSLLAFASRVSGCRAERLG
jgi:hypothetical protein